MACYMADGDCVVFAIFDPNGNQITAGFNESGKAIDATVREMTGIKKCGHPMKNAKTRRQRREFWLEMKGRGYEIKAI